MKDWREQHFGIPEGPARLRDGTPEPTARWPYAVLALLIVSPIAAVGTAYHLGKFDPPPPTVVERELVRERTVVVDRPAPPPVAQPVIAQEARPTITQARANELQRLIESRDRGLDLLYRDHAKVKQAFDEATHRLSAAQSRLAMLDASRPPLSDSAGSYRWSIAREDALSSVNTATAEHKRQKSLNDSFVSRIQKATSEREDARTILATHDVTP